MFPSTRILAYTCMIVEYNSTVACRKLILTPNHFQTIKMKILMKDPQADISIFSHHCIHTQYIHWQTWCNTQHWSKDLSASCKWKYWHQFHPLLPLIAQIWILFEIHWIDIVVRFEIKRMWMRSQIQLHTPHHKMFDDVPSPKCLNVLSRERLLSVIHETGLPGAGINS